mmetsp:Transcript_27254/g.77030  ORF Transcript_27254/g.77030 Transcript_27254/m.77030 type:complete len:898 (+) Transcript_27254:399-3092(+)
MVLVWPVAGRDPLCGPLPPLLQRLLRAPSRRCHADVRDGTDQVLPVEHRLVLDDGLRVAVHRAGVPEQEVARFRHQLPRAAVALGEDGVVGLDHQEVPTVIRLSVVPEDLAVEAVRPGNDHQAAGLRGRVRQRQEALDTMQAALAMRLVHVVPVLLRGLPLRVVAVGPEDAGAVVGGDELARPPEVGEDAPELLQAPQEPHHGGLADAAVVYDAVGLPGRPASAVLGAVAPRHKLPPAHHREKVGPLNEIPQHSVRCVDLVRLRDAGDHDEALVVEVRPPALVVRGLEALRRQGPDDGQPRHGRAELEEPVDVQLDFPNGGIEALQGVDLGAHVLDALEGPLKPELRQHLHLLLERLLHVRRLAGPRRLPDAVVVALELRVREGGAQLHQHPRAGLDADLQEGGPAGQPLPRIVLVGVAAVCPQTVPGEGQGLHDDDAVHGRERLGGEQLRARLAEAVQEFHVAERVQRGPQVGHRGVLVHGEAQAPGAAPQTQPDLQLLLDRGGGGLRRVEPLGLLLRGRHVPRQLANPVPAGRPDARVRVHDRVRQLLQAARQLRAELVHALPEVGRLVDAPDQAQLPPPLVGLAQARLRPVQQVHEDLEVAAAAGLEVPVDEVAQGVAAEEEAGLYAQEHRVHLDLARVLPEVLDACTYDLVQGVHELHLHFFEGPLGLRDPHLHRRGAHPAVPLQLTLREGPRVDDRFGLHVALEGLRGLPGPLLLLCQRLRGAGRRHSLVRAHRLALLVRRALGGAAGLAGLLPAHHAEVPVLLARELVAELQRGRLFQLPAALEHTQARCTGGLAGGGDKLQVVAAGGEPARCAAQRDPVEQGVGQVQAARVGVPADADFERPVVDLPRAEHPLLRLALLRVCGVVLGLVGRCDRTLASLDLAVLRARLQH